MQTTKIKKILVVGGAGYVGSTLVPKLLKKGYQVRVFDLYIYSQSEKLGEDIFGNLINDKNLEQIKGDVRDAAAIGKAVTGVDAIIHLACISNDPSFELDRNLGKSINYLAFFPFLEAVNKHHIKRLIYISTSSVYGLKKEKEVTEELPLEPLTDYALYKVLCEKALTDHLQLSKTPWVIIRPATICGYSPRLRLDLTVNILTNHGVNKGEITVFGGDQERPNIHMDDITDLYVKMLEYPTAKIAGKIFNAGFDNLKIITVAKKVKKILGKNIAIKVSPSDDKRSYRVSSQKIKKELGWYPQKTVDDAIADLIAAFKNGKITKPLTNPIYFNIEMMKKISLK
jgi:nucleoside-diphosphate-sugar epimerase